MSGSCWVAIVVMLVGCASQPRTLDDRLATMVRSHRGRVAVFAHDLATGRTIAIDADREVKTASAIKLAVLIAAFHQVKAGQVALADRVVLEDRAKVYGSGVLPFLHGGLELTFEDALVLMMILSDNTATNLAIDHVGGVAAVNRRLAALGLAHTHLYKKVYVPATEPMPPDQKQFGLGKSTARELATLMLSIQRCELGDPALCQRMLAIMRNQHARYLSARFLETADTSETPSAIAAKLGELDAARIEVALIAGRAGPIVLAVVTYENADVRYSPENEGGLLISRIAEAVVRAWSPAGIETGKP
ncbi:MAG: serine hydrolase [Kofleriaceae bacterium]